MVGCISSVTTIKVLDSSATRRKYHTISTAVYEIRFILITLYFLINPVSLLQIISLFQLPSPFSFACSSSHKLQRILSSQLTQHRLIP
jgi:hypothetical protein